MIRAKGEKKAPSQQEGTGENICCDDQNVIDDRTARGI